MLDFVDELNVLVNVSLRVGRIAEHERELGDDVVAGALFGYRQRALLERLRRCKLVLIAKQNRKVAEARRRLGMFGAKRLPEIGRSLGKGMREFKESVTGHDDPDHSVHELTAPPPEQPVTAARPREHDTV